jgi:hypothetical protein
LVQAANPAVANDATPMTALIGVAAATTNANLAIPAGVSKAVGPPTHLLKSNAAMKASKPFPTAIAHEVPNDPAVVKLVTKAPKKIAGKIRKPRRSVRPSARPVGGQTGVALGLIDANARLAFANAK